MEPAAKLASMILLSNKAGSRPQIVQYTSEVLSQKRELEMATSLGSDVNVLL